MGLRRRSVPVSGEHILPHLETAPSSPHRSSYITLQDPSSMDLMNTGSNRPKQSIEGRPTLQRQSSTSSSASAGSSHTRPRKAIRSVRRRTSASGAQAAEDEQTGSRRGSISSMRTSSTPLEGPVTYTPTTHRISKAKKGKRVHACEFHGCNKVWLRCLVRSNALIIIGIHPCRAPKAARVEP